MNESDLIIRIRSGENAACELVYQFCYPSIEALVTNNSGTIDDAKDIFQESLIVLLDNVKQPDFRLTASLKTYLYAIAKNLWFKRLRTVRNVSVVEENVLEGFCEPTNLRIEIKEDESLEEKISRWLNKITQHCRNLLSSIFINNEPMDKIMKRLGYKTKHSADNQKYKCLEQVRKAADG